MDDEPKPTQLFGIKPFPIQGRMARERERLANPMTPEERKMRAQWVRDQLLSPNEPVHVPQIEIELRNPIRRFYRAPLDKLFRALEPTMGTNVAAVSRILTGKILMTIAGVYLAVYYFKYNRNDWTRQCGWRVVMSRVVQLPGDPGFGKMTPMSPQDYEFRGFHETCPLK